MRQVLTGQIAVILAIAFVLGGCSAVPNLDQGGMGCQNAGDGTQRSGNPTDPGQPLAGINVSGRSPADVGREAEARGLVVRYQLEYAIGNDGGGYTECWCTPPTEGQVSEVFWGSNGQLFVHAATAMKSSWRDQPTFGWGCTSLFG